MVQKTLVELNDKYNLFKYLLGVDITVYLDEDLVSKSREAIEKLLKVSPLILEILNQIFELNMYP